MLPTLTELKHKRKLSGLTQSELAHLSGVSQSLVAKTEAGQIVPSYDNVKRLFDTLESQARKESLKAQDVMTRKVVYVEKGASVREAVKAMEQRGISQIPVLQKGQSLGTITEKTVLAKLGGHPEQVWDTKKVEAVMEESLPVITSGSAFPLLSSMLQHYPALLVARKGRIVGVISKSDLLQNLLKQH